MVYRDQSFLGEQFRRGFVLLQERGYATVERGYVLTPEWGITYKAIREELPGTPKELIMTLAILFRGPAAPSDISYMSLAISVLDKIEKQRN